MSEKEKNAIVKLSESVSKLDREDQKYILGMAEGMVMAKENQKFKAENEEGVLV